MVDNHYKIWSVADASGNNWNNNDGRETFKAVETAYSLYHEAASIENKIRAAKIWQLLLLQIIELIIQSWQNANFWLG